MICFHDYKRQSIRKKHFNYSQSAYYFITICTQNREHLFGEVINGNMILNKYGQIIKNYWSEIPHHFKQIKLDEFIVMPNHIHGIIQCELWDSFVGALQCNALKQEINTNHYFSTITPKKNSLSSIIRSFKSICTREIRKIKGPYIVWQKNFYDIIIHNKTQLKTIKYYIKINPKIWNRDRNNMSP